MSTPFNSLQLNDQGIFLTTTRFNMYGMNCSADEINTKISFPKPTVQINRLQARAQGALMACVENDRVLSVQENKMRNQDIHVKELETQLIADFQTIRTLRDRVKVLEHEIREFKRQVRKNNDINTAHSIDLNEAEKVISFLSNNLDDAYTDLSAPKIADEGEGRDKNRNRNVDGCKGEGLVSKGTDMAGSAVRTWSFSGVRLDCGLLGCCRELRKDRHANRDR